MLSQQQRIIGCDVLASTPAERIWLPAYTYQVCVGLIMAGMLANLIHAHILLVKVCSISVGGELCLDCRVESLYPGQFFCIWKERGVPGVVVQSLPCNLVVDIYIHVSTHNLIALFSYQTHSTVFWDLNGNIWTDHVIFKTPHPCVTFLAACEGNIAHTYTYTGPSPS